MPETNDPIVWYPGHELLVPDVVRAENCHLYDARGKRYVDLESGVWCASVGHAHPRILRVLAEQPARIAHTGFGYSSAIVAEAAREILALLGMDGGKCVFLCSGSEAVEYGVRVAQSVATRPLTLTMSDSYFGAYGAAALKAPDAWFGFDWAPCAACPHGGACGERCAHWSAVPHDRIGAFLLEPGSSSGLVRFPPATLVRHLADGVRQNGGLLLVNEVTTGIGRTGEWFGHQHYGIAPDVVALGKGIGNGYPVSVAAFGPRVVERLGDRSVRYAQSHQNDPLGAAVAREVIRVIRDEGLIARGREIAAVLAAGLEGVRARTGRIREVRARGLMAAVELEGDATRVHRALVQRGFIVGLRPDAGVLRLDPSLTIDRRDIEEFVATLEAVLNEA